MPPFLVAARRDIDPTSIIAAAIAFRKEMKLSIRARCQATANESGVKPPHSKVTNGCNLKSMPAELIASAQRQSVFIPPSALPLILIIGRSPNNQIDADGSSPLECGGSTPPFLVAARRDIDPTSIIAAAIAFRKEMKLFIRARCQATALQTHPTGVTYRPMPAELIASAPRQSVFIPPSALPLICLLGCGLLVDRWNLCKDNWGGVEDDWS